MVQLLGAKVHLCTFPLDSQSRGSLVGSWNKAHRAYYNQEDLQIKLRICRTKKKRKKKKEKSVEVA